MIQVIYPERRWVSEETVIQWAHDRLVNDAAKTSDTDIDLLILRIERPTLEESIYILEDSGECSFGATR